MTSLPPSTPTKSPSFWRWLMLVLALVVVMLAIVRYNQALDPEISPTQLRKISVIPPFALTERSGRQITNHDLEGKIWIADFIYTTCPGPCPMITAEMARFQAATANDPHVQSVSFTVDPVTDTPGVLAKYADVYKADPNRWWFLTGPEKTMYELIQNGFLQSVRDNRGLPAEPGQFTVTHSTYFALIDGDGNMRGVYRGNDPDEYNALLRDIKVLEKEAGP